MYIYDASVAPYALHIGLDLEGCQTKMTYVSDLAPKKNPPFIPLEYEWDGRMDG